MRNGFQKLRTVCSDFRSNLDERYEPESVRNRGRLFIRLKYIAKFMLKFRRILVDLQKVVYCGAVTVSSSLATFITGRYQVYRNQKNNFGKVQEELLAQAKTNPS